MNYRNEQRIDGKMFEAFIMGGAGMLQENIDRINALNVFPIPDGDTGYNMYRTLSGGIRETQKASDSTVGAKAQALAAGMLFSARGNSGVILSQIFAGIGNALEPYETATVKQLAESFISGYRQAYDTVVSPVEGTILTVAREPIELLYPSIGDDMTLGDFADAFLPLMNTTLKNTPELLDVLKKAGVIDSGGAGLYLIAQGAAQVLSGERIYSETSNVSPAPSDIDLSLFSQDSVFEYGYCTEFLLRLMTAKTDVESFDETIIIDYLNTIGDSIVAFKNGSIIKVHVHTFTPHKALEFCQQFGEFLTVKIENMMLQHNEHEHKKNADLPTADKARQHHAVCVVASGSGMIAVFKELGADCVIDGGQGKNPAIGDFIAAFDALNADNIYVFPNNSNILMAAEQAGKLYTKSAVHVIPSINLGQAYAGLSMLDYSYDTPEEIRQNFIDSINYVETGMVCRAIRNVDYPELSVRKDDYIGFVYKNILSDNPDKIAALKELCESLKIADKEIATVIYGAEATDNDRENVRSLFRSDYADKEFYEIDGGQEIYDFIVVLE